MVISENTKFDGHIPGCIPSEHYQEHFPLFDNPRWLAYEYKQAKGNKDSLSSLLSNPIILSNIKGKGITAT